MWALLRSITVSDHGKVLGRRGALGFLLTMLAACAPNAPQDTLRPDGPIGAQINSLWWPVFWIAVVIFFIVEGAIVYAVIKYRSHGQDPMAPKQVHGNTKLEVAWTVVPIVILTGVAIATLFGIASIARKPEGDFLKVTVTAHQWWWEYEYPEEGVVAANELHIPIGKAVYLELKSVDVIHSFWVPKLAGKQDVIPGRSNFMTIKATRPDTYFGQCVEFCGLSHANMRLLVVSESQEDFEEWIAEQKQSASKPTSTLAAEGERLFQAGACAGCHTVDGTNAQGKTGPNLTHLFARQRFAGAIFDLNRENLVRWLRDPPAMKPMQPDKGLGMPNLNLKEEEIEALVAYLETLK